MKRPGLDFSLRDPLMISEFILEFPSSMGNDLPDRQSAGMPDPGKGPGQK